MRVRSLVWPVVLTTPFVFAIMLWLGVLFAFWPHEHWFKNVIRVFWCFPVPLPYLPVNEISVCVSGLINSSFWTLSIAFACQWMANEIRRIFQTATTLDRDGNGSE